MRWNPELIWTDILAVHAALLHTGEILFFTGNEFWGKQHDDKLYDHVRLFNCQTLGITKVDIPSTLSDLFCCGHALFGSGNLLMAGGTKELNIDAHHGLLHFIGERRTWMFDVNAKRLIECKPLNLNPNQKDTDGQIKQGTGGRWYPTLVTLGNGKILAIGGHPDRADDRHSADMPEYFEWNIWRYAEGGTDPEINFKDARNPLEYPRLHLLPDGRIFSSTPLTGDTVRWYELDVGWQTFSNHTPSTSDWRNPSENNNSDTYYQIYNQFNGTSVLLPLLPENNYSAKVMVHGNTNSYIIDLSASQPSWQQVGGRRISKRRLTVNSVILPTGEIFFCGGIDARDYQDRYGVNEGEIYNPFTEEWSLTPAAQVVRNYHSVALLMPDGRVWTAGSSKNHYANSAEVRELRIEIFEPDYYGLPTRPIIHEVIADQGDVVSGVRGGFTVITGATNEIKRVAIIRNGSITHGFNSDQRYVGLPFTTHDYQGGLKALRVSIPDEPNLMVPGHYMLFLIDSNGVPSEGIFINIRLQWSDWFERTEEGSEDHCISAPALASFAKNRLDVFAKRFVNNGVWHKWWNGTRWSGWESIGDEPVSSAPAAVSRGPNRLDVFAKGMHDELAHKAWDGNNWSNWNNLGGPISSAPAAVFHQNNWHIFARGLSGEPAYKKWDGVNPSNWQNLGGEIASTPAAVFHGNIWHIFARGLHDELAYMPWDGLHDSNWQTLDKEPISFAPCATTWGANRIDVFARGTSKELAHKSWDGNNWSNWASLGGVLAYSPAAVSWGLNRIDVVGVALGGNLLHKYW